MRVTRVWLWMVQVFSKSASIIKPSVVSYLCSGDISVQLNPKLHGGRHVPRRRSSDYQIQLIDANRYSTRDFGQRNNAPGTSGRMKHTTSSLKSSLSWCLF